MKNEMELKAKAQTIYNELLKEEPSTLEALILQTSMECSDDPVMTIDDWAEGYKNNGNIFDLIQTVQKAEDLDIYDDYIRLGSYYYTAKTSTSVLDLVDKEEAIEWIAETLECDPECIEDFYEDGDSDY